jgi:hypothetical protein
VRLGRLAVGAPTSERRFGLAFSIRRGAGADSPWSGGESEREAPLPGDGANVGSRLRSVVEFGAHLVATPSARGQRLWMPTPR